MNLLFIWQWVKMLECGEIIFKNDIILGTQLNFIVSVGM